jgi:hypothetical protein
VQVKTEQTPVQVKTEQTPGAGTPSAPVQVKMEQTPADAQQPPQQPMPPQVAAAPTAPPAQQYGGAVAPAQPFATQMQAQLQALQQMAQQPPPPQQQLRFVPQLPPLQTSPPQSAYGSMPAAQRTTPPAPFQQPHYAGHPLSDSAGAAPQPPQAHDPPASLSTDPAIAFSQLQQQMQQTQSRTFPPGGAL